MPYPVGGRDWRCGLLPGSPLSAWKNRETLPLSIRRELAPSDVLICIPAPGTLRNYIVLGQVTHCEAIYPLPPESPSPMPWM